MKRIRFWLLILLFVNFIACSKYAQNEKLYEEEPFPVLNVYIAENAKQYTAVKALQDDNVRAEMEEELKIRINLIDFGFTDDIEALYEVNFSGVLLTGDPKWILPLVERSMLMEFKDKASVTKDILGRYRGKQFGYVFKDSHSEKIQPVLAVVPEALSILGLTDIPFTADSFSFALEKLSESFQTPLVVYGSPAEEGFSVLLELFEISPLGGREFYLEDNQVEYDKISHNADEYLAYVYQLYQKEYIPEDFLVLSQYSGIGMLAYGKSAMAVLPNMKIAEEAIHSAEKMGRHVALVKLPVDSSCTESNIYSCLVGLVSSKYTDTGKARSFLDELQSITMDIVTEENDEFTPEWYPLFSDTGLFRRYAFDPAEMSLPDIRRLYEKHILDTKYINPYFSQITTGMLPLSSVSEMRDKWLLEQVTEQYVDLSGSVLIYLFTNWYHVKINNR